MGIPFRYPEPDRAPNITETGIDWLKDAGPERVSIDLDAGCLCRLLREHQLHIEDFSCTDEPSRACVRRLLLALLRNKG